MHHFVITGNETLRIQITALTETSKRHFVMDDLRFPLFNRLMSTERIVSVMWWINRLLIFNSLVLKGCEELSVFNDRTRFMGKMGHCRKSDLGEVQILL